MAFKGITATGVIDIKSSLLSGKIESGSLGLLFAFFGVVLLLVPLFKKHEIRTVFRQKTKKQEIDWSHWESGDPYVELIEEIFPDEEIPDDVLNQPFVDWISESKIEKMVDLYLQDTLKDRSISFIDYHFSNDLNKAKEITGAISEILQHVIIGSKSNELTTKAHKLRESEFVEEMVYMLAHTVDWYFNVKKRIFAGWDKYPTCYPPVHKELAIWLEHIEKKWVNIIQDLKQLILPNKAGESDGRNAGGLR